MTIIKNFKELLFIIFSIVVLIFVLFYALFIPINIFLNPERFVCSRLKNECIYINSKENRVYDLSQINSASCRKIYHPGIKAGHTETWLVIVTNNGVLKQEEIYRTGLCENQAKKLNIYLNSVENNFKIKQVIDSFSISIILYLLSFLLFFGVFFKNIFAEIIKFFKS